MYALALKHRQKQYVIVCGWGRTAECQCELEVPHRVHLIHDGTLLCHEYLRLVDHLHIAFKKPSLLLPKLIYEARGSRILSHHILLL